MNRMRRMILPLALMLNACVPVTPSDTASRGVIVDSTFPPMKTFGVPRPSRPVKSNNDLALDFIELPFRLESGRDLLFSNALSNRLWILSKVRHLPAWVLI